MSVSDDLPTSASLSPSLCLFLRVSICPSPYTLLWLEGGWPRGCPLRGQRVGGSPRPPREPQGLGAREPGTSQTAIAPRPLAEKRGLTEIPALFFSAPHTQPSEEVAKKELGSGVNDPIVLRADGWSCLSGTPPHPWREGLRWPLITIGGHLPAGGCQASLFGGVWSAEALACSPPPPLYTHPILYMGLQGATEGGADRGNCPWPSTINLGRLAQAWATPALSIFWTIVPSEVTWRSPALPHFGWGNRRGGLGRNMTRNRTRSCDFLPRCARMGPALGHGGKADTVSPSRDSQAGSGGSACQPKIITEE